MKKISFVAILLFACTFSAAAQTQSNTTPGPVWRVIYYRVLPGKMNDVMMELRRNFRPISEEGKKQGILVDYKIFQNSTQSSPDDWNLAVAILYKNWGAIDGSTAKMNAISLKHHGSQEKIDAAQAYLIERRVLVASKLVREQTLNPLP